MHLINKRRRRGILDVSESVSPGKKKWNKFQDKISLVSKSHKGLGGHTFGLDRPDENASKSKNFVYMVK